MASGYSPRREPAPQPTRLVVGTQLDRTLHFEDDWRLIIATVRRYFEGTLTYAANWTDYEKVPFWDALDVIGIQAYFPLLEDGKRATPVSTGARMGTHYGTFARL